MKTRKRNIILHKKFMLIGVISIGIILINILSISINLILNYGNIFYVDHEGENIFQIRSTKSRLINVNTGEITEGYDDIDCYSDGLCETRLNNKYGIIDLNSNIPLGPYDNIECNSDGLCKTVSNHKSTIIDLNGNKLLGPLDEGISISKIKSPYVIIRKYQQHGVQYGVIDMQGNIVVDYLPWHRYISNIDYSSQIAYIGNHTNNKYGFINLEENLFIEPLYEELTEFIDKISVAKLNGKYGFINDKNEVLEDFIYDEAHFFTDGLARVQYNSKYGYIDKLGNVVIDIQFDEANDFTDGLALVQYNSKYGYIDVLGNVVIEFQYDAASDFVDGVAHVEFDNSDGFINKNNEKIIPIHNSSHEIEYKNEYSSFGKCKYYFMNPDGSILYKNCGEDYGLTFDGTKIINQKGNIILDKDFNKIRYINDNMFCVETNRWECYNMEGEKLFEHEYFSYYSNEDSPFILFKDKLIDYVYDKNGNLIYKTSRNWGEKQLLITKSNQFIFIVKSNKIISYDINTKEKKVIYKVPFTIKSIFDW